MTNRGSWGWRRLAYAGGAIAGVVVLGFALALVLIDGETVRDAIGARLEATLGQPVELGDADLTLFPLPAARILDARVGGSTPWLEARSVRVGVSLMGLLAGQVVLRSVELEAPRIRLDVAGEPITGSRWNEAAAEDVTLAITDLSLRDGTLEIGDERLEQVEVSGGLGATLGASFDFSARIPELGGIEDGELSIEGLTGPLEEWRWTAQARLGELDLTALRGRLNMAGLWGKAKGTLEAKGQGLGVERGALAIESQDFEVRTALLRVWGPTRLEVEYPGALQVDLSDASLSVVQSVEKPAGVPFRIASKELVFADSALELRELDVTSDGVRAAGRVQLGGARTGIEISAASIELAELASWTGPEWLPRKGSVEVERLVFAGDPPALSADGALTNVAVKLPGGVDAILSGAVLANGTTIGADSLNVVVADESISTSLRYDWLASTIDVALATEGTQVAPVLENAFGFKDVSGRLYARLNVSGPLDPYKLTGSGEFELVDAEWNAFSLATAVFREPPEEMVGRTDPIQRVRGRIEIQEDEVKLIDVSVEQDYAQATLSGELYLRDLTVDTSGKLTAYTPDMEEPLVLDILKVGGPLNALTMNVANGETEDVRNAEAAMLEAFRKAEREARDKEKQQRRQEPSGD